MHEPKFFFFFFFFFCKAKNFLYSNESISLKKKKKSTASTQFTFCPRKGRGQDVVWSGILFFTPHNKFQKVGSPCVYQPQCFVRQNLVEQCDYFCNQKTYVHNIKEIQAELQKRACGRNFIFPACLLYRTW